MSLSTKKPDKIEDFIVDVKEESLRDEYHQEKTEKEKSYTIKMPYKVWKMAKQKALEKDMTLQNFIVEQIIKGFQE